MNVLYVCADRGIPVLGNKGASVHLRSLTGAMQSLGHQVAVLVRRLGEGNDPPPVGRLERLAGGFDQAVDQLEQAIRRERPDVVIERYSLQSGAVREATRRCGIELTLEVNAPLVREATSYRGLDDPDAEDWEHETFRGADRIHVVSSALAGYIGRVAPETPIALIPNGADVARLHGAPIAELPGCQGRVVVGFVGSMKPWHGTEQLLEAFARVHRAHPHAALAFVGAGPVQAELVERTGQLGLRDSVIFTGQVPHAQIPSLLTAIDIGVAPYLPLEGFYFHPLKVVEYLAAGKPVIYSDQGDMARLVGPAGIGYEPGSVDELARALGRLLENPTLRRQLALIAPARGAGFDWRVIADRVLRFARGAPEAVSLC